MARRATRLLDPDLTVVFGGVDCAAVRAVLAQAHEQLTSTLEEIERLRTTHAEVMTELVAAQEQEREATRTLSRAEQEARQIREAAGHKAARVVAAAEERAANLLRDAERERSALVGQVERWRERRLRLANIIQSELDELASFARQTDTATAPHSLSLSERDQAPAANPMLPGDLAYEAVPSPASQDVLDPAAWVPVGSISPEPEDWSRPASDASSDWATPSADLTAEEWMPSASADVRHEPDVPHETVLPADPEPKPMDWSLRPDPQPLADAIPAPAPPQPATPMAPRRTVPVAVSSKPRPLVQRILRPAFVLAAAGITAALILAVVAWPRLQALASEPAAPAKPVKAVSRKTTPSTSSQRTSGSVARPAETSDAPRDGMQLTIRATSPCWIKLTIGERVESRLLNPGETLTRQSRGDVLLRAGNAAALQVSVNGLELPPLGPEGAVVTKRISPPIHGSAAR